MKLKSWIIHPILFSLYPILFYYSHNIGQISFESIIKPIAITVTSAVFVWWLLRLILKDWHRAGGIVSLFLILFFSYGHVRTNIDTNKVAFILPAACVIILLAGGFAIIKSKKRFVNGTKLLNLVSVVLISLVTINTGIFFVKTSITGKEVSTIELSSVKAGQSHGVQKYPDIYFIILDAYAREDVLRDIYDFDNSDFLGFLRSKEFYVADRAVSNYCQTGLSLGSSLNLTYLDDWVKKLGEDSLSRGPLNYIIKQSLAVDFLKKQGYKIVAFASTRPETEIKNADVFLNSGITVNEFHAGLINATPLPDIKGSKKVEDVFTKYRKHAYYMFDNLGKVAAEQESPKFVFAHIELPHPPFVFGPNGESVQLESRFNDHDGNWLIRRGRLTTEQYRKHYRDQVIFTNKQMKRVISEILDNSSQPPILLILSDHGPRSGLVWESAEMTDVKESLTILNAFHLPGNGNEILYPEISPVNSFRIVFNHYFGSNLELLPDRSFFSTARYLYKFQDVTDRVNNTSPKKQ
jgi:hypothetical protein